MLVGTAKVGMAAIAVVRHVALRGHDVLLTDDLEGSVRHIPRRRWCSPRPLVGSLGNGKRGGMKVYKIVRLEHGIGISVMATGYACVEYRLGVPARPPELLRVAGYGLTAYDDPDAAAAVLVNCHFLCELWEAEAEDVSRTLPPSLDLDQLSQGVLEKSKSDWPPHTIMASKLTILKKIGYQSMDIYVPAKFQGGAYRGIGPNKGIVFPVPTPPSRYGDIVSPRSGGIHGYGTKSVAVKKASAQASHLLEGRGIGVLFNLRGLGPGEVMAKVFEVAKVIPLPNPLQMKKTGS